MLLALVRFPVVVLRRVWGAYSGHILDDWVQPHDCCAEDAGVRLSDLLLMSGRYVTLLEMRSLLLVLALEHTFVRGLHRIFRCHLWDCSQRGRPGKYFVKILLCEALVLCKRRRKGKLFGCLDRRLCGQVVGKAGQALMCY